MSDDQFTKLFKYMEQRFETLEQGQAKLKTDINRVYDLVDEVLKNQETDRQERLVVNRQLDQHDDWIIRAAKQLGLSYER